MPTCSTLCRCLGSSSSSRVPNHSTSHQRDTRLSTVAIFAVSPTRPLQPVSGSSRWWTVRRLPRLCTHIRRSLGPAGRDRRTKHARVWRPGPASRIWPRCVPCWRRRRSDAGWRKYGRSGCWTAGASSAGGRSDAGHSRKQPVWHRAASLLARRHTGTTHSANRTISLDRHLHTSFHHLLWFIVDVLRTCKTHTVSHSKRSTARYPLTVQA